MKLSWLSDPISGQETALVVDIRRFLVLWFHLLATGASGRVRLILYTLTDIGNNGVDLIGLIRGSILDTIDWLMSWSPWPISLITDYFGLLLKDYLVNPLLELLKTPFWSLLNWVTDQWSDDLNDYRLAYWVSETISKIGLSLLALIDYLEDFATAIGDSVKAVFIALIAVLQAKLYAVTYDLSMFRVYVTQTLAREISSLVYKVQMQGQAILSLQNALEDILDDPGTWVWDQVIDGLTERVRQWLWDEWG